MENIDFKELSNSEWHDIIYNAVLECWKTNQMMNYTLGMEGK